MSELSVDRDHHDPTVEQKLNDFTMPQSSGSDETIYAILNYDLSPQHNSGILEARVKSCAAELLELGSKYDFHTTKMNEIEIERFLGLINNFEQSDNVSARDKLAVKMIIYTGVRVSEALNLKLKDIFPEGEVYLLQIRGKGDKMRVAMIKRSHIQDLLDLWLIKRKELKIKSEYLKTFKNFITFKETVKRVKMSEYRFLINLLERYNDGILECIETIEKNIVGKKQADITFVSSHKSKDLQFLDVKLADDFVDLYDKNGSLIPVEQVDSEELNLLYGAITRDMERLELNKDLIRLI